MTSCSCDTPTLSVTPFRWADTGGICIQVYPVCENCCGIVSDDMREKAATWFVESGNPPLAEVSNDR